MKGRQAMGENRQWLSPGMVPPPVRGILKRIWAEAMEAN